MKHSARYALIALSFAAPALVAAAPTANKKPAESRLITLEPHTPQQFRSTSNNGFVLIAFTNSSLLVNDQATTLRAGDSHQVRGSQMLDIVNTSALPSELVLIKVDTASQGLTLLQERLDMHQELEDASDRNDTLVVALTPIALRDVRDLADEDEPLKSSAPRTIVLQQGGSAWLAPGMHRLVNVGKVKARFITIEW
jgi:hypothetical protein